MRSDPRPFYDRLAAEYPAWIRHLVPRYDELLEEVVGALVAEAPARILDIGAGVGELAATLLARLPEATLTAVEPSPEMAQRAYARLSRFEGRARVLRADVRALETEQSYEAVVTTLVLHNLPVEGRAGVLRRLPGWLTPGGVFVWADFVRMEDPELQSQVTRLRRDLALEAGCPADVVEWNFRKEDREDAPLTVAQSVSILRRAGFSSVDVRWAHDAFAVLQCRVDS